MMPSDLHAVRRLFLVIFPIFLVGAMTGHALAATDEEAQPAIRWNGQAELSWTDFNYREYNDGSLLDQERGGLPGVVFALTAEMGHWALGGRFSWHAGDVLYDGQTNTGIPIATHTEESILDTSVRIDRSFGPVDDPALTLYGGFGYRYWGRDIRPTYTGSGQPVDGLYEIYRWKYFLVGGKTAIYRTGRSRWSLDARVMRPYRPTIEVDQQGRYDTVILDLDERTGWRVALPWEYRLSARTHWVIEPYMEAWDIGLSSSAPLTQNGVQVDNKTLYEPRSTTRNLGIAMGFRRFF